MRHRSRGRARRTIGRTEHRGPADHDHDEDGRHQVRGAPPRRDHIVLPAIGREIVIHRAPLSVNHPFDPSVTRAPSCKVSGGESITLSVGETPATTSTLSPKSRPSVTVLRATLPSALSSATCVPWLAAISAVAGTRTMVG